MLEFFSYPPVLRGFVLLMTAGVSFPLCGVFILRLNLLPIRFLLMHGVLLGGAISLALNLDQTVTILFANIALVLLLGQGAKTLKADYGQLSMFFMTASIAAASIVISVFNVPARDTLTLLWGSLYTADARSISIALLLSMVLVGFTVRYFRHLTVCFYDRDVARAMNVNTELLELAVILLIALVVALAMKLMGALLLDVIILLPVISAGFLVSGLKKMMILSCVLGAFFSFSGFLISLRFDLPVSAGVAVPAVVLFLITLIIKRGMQYEPKS